MSSADTYPDLYLRAVSGGSALPRNGGAQSPDIVPWGTATVPSPQTLADPPLWDQDPGQPWVPDVANNIYLRCANGSSRDARGELHLAIGTPALPHWPDQLKELPGPGGKPAPVKVSGAGRAATSTPFACTPFGHSDTLAAWVVTTQHAPNPSIPLRSVQALKQFFVDFPGYVQRSVAFGIDESYRYVARYQQRDVAAEMKLELRISGCNTAWTVSVLADDAGFPLQIPRMPLNDPDMIVFKTANVPAGSETTLTLLIDTHGVAPAPQARIDLLLSLMVPPAGSDAQSIPFRLASHSWRAGAPPTDAHVRGSTHHRSQP